MNGVCLPIQSFKDYVEQYTGGKEDDAGNTLNVVWDTCGARWEVAICASNQGFQQISFVNSIATLKGGKHVDHVVDLVVKRLTDIINRRNKTGLKIQPKQIKEHMWIFISCEIVNPTFDSQSKETMTKVAKSFGSKCEFSDKFKEDVSKVGIVESVLFWLKFRAHSMLATSTTDEKTSKLTGRICFDLNIVSVT